MIYLQNYLLNSEKIEFNDNTGGCVKVVDNDVNTSGFFLFLEDDLLAVYVNQGVININVNSHKISIQDVEKIQHIELDNGQSRLLINSTSSIFCDFTYQKDEPVSSIFFSEDKEDCDFGLWLFNLLQSKERQEIFIENNPPLAPE